MKNLRLYAKPIMWLSALLMTAFVSGCGGGDQGRDPILGLPASTLVALEVSPANAAVAIGNAQQFIAKATYADGTSIDVTKSATWSSDKVAFATVTSTDGIARGVAIGIATITANFGGKVNSAILNVTQATLLSIAVTPANPSIAIGGQQQFIAMGSFSDGSSSDITAITTFSPETPSVATIIASGPSAGLASGVSSGTAVISGTSGIRTGKTTLTVTSVTLQSIAITPINPSVQVGATQQLIVTAIFSDSSTADVTRSTAFTPGTPSVASIGASTGLITGVAAGSALMTGNYNGKTASTTVTVTAPLLSSIVITPANPSMLVGSSLQFTATGNYADGTTGNITNTVTWVSSVRSVASILPTGKASALTVGSTIISATQGVNTASTTLTVTAPVIATGVNLASATNFGVLAGTSITNNSGGTTLVTGDVGSPSQTVDPVQAAGFNNYKSGAVLTTALADMQVAITDANSRTCDVNSAAGIDLGGQTFGPGVYCYAGAINITGTFTMNGPGLYIFRTSSTLNSTANSIVALNGGATAGKVFWVPVAATTLGANSFFKGTIMTKSAAITMGDNASLQNGRVLSGSAVTLKNNVISR